MATIQLSIIEARSRITSLPEDLAENPGAVVVTRRGTPVLAILPWDMYESIVETLEILGDAELTASLRQSLKEASEANAILWNEAKKDMGESHDTDKV